MEESIAAKARKIKLLLLDVDGVLTDGKIIYDSQGGDQRCFYVQDGLGVFLLKRAGIPTVLITAKSSSAILPRAKDMQVEEVLEVFPKSSVLPKLLGKYEVHTEELCFVGDDLVDLSLMKKVGLPVAVFNAAPEIKQSAAYITLREGGRGAVREIAELILKAQGKWQESLDFYNV